MRNQVKNLVFSVGHWPLRAGEAEGSLSIKAVDSSP